MGQLRILSFVGITISIFIALFLSFIAISFPRLDLSSLFGSNLILEPSEDDWNHFYHLGGNGPWIEKKNARFGTYDRDGKVPQGCVVDQVHVLARHAERHPTRNAGNRHKSLLSRLESVTLNGSLSFLNDRNWTYFVPQSSPETPIASFENLTTATLHAGTLSAFTLGTTLQTRYPHLLPLPGQNPLNIWSCSSPRDVETALYFTDGLLGRDWANPSTSSDHQPPRGKLHIIPESPSRGGNTLTPSDTCQAYSQNTTHGHDMGYHALAKWQSILSAPIIARLSTTMNPSLNPPLSPQEIYSMMEMCGFEILARGTGTSPWCDVFSRTEWEEFEYARDLLHFYRAGPGNPFARLMGSLWLEATAGLAARESEDDGEGKGKGKGEMYVSFVHDGDIVPVLAALGLFDEDGEQTLPTDRVKVDRNWRTSDVVPMAGRLVVERLNCRTPQGWRYREVRSFVNDGWVGWPVQGRDGETVFVPQVEVGRFKGIVDKLREEVGGFRQGCGLGEDVEEKIGFLHQ